MEMHTINSIKNKLRENNATIFKADKGNTLVIWYTDEQIAKTNEFIRNNHFSPIPNDPTNTFQNEIRKIVNLCKHTIRKEDKWKYICLNPTAHTLRGLPKIHRNNTLIRPIINWQNAPAHKLAQLLSRLIEMHTPLPYTFNVNNSVHLMEDLESIPISHSTKFAPLDIANMYSNVPTKEVINILELLGTHPNVDPAIINELITITNTIMKQNYFTFLNNWYTQNDGLAMGAPTSPILSEIYLQYMEHSHLYTILTENKILGYFRYVDDILIMYNEEDTDIERILNQFNNAMPTMQFSIEKETNNTISFLDITIHKNHDSLSFSVYRKPTTTDTIIPKESCHPIEHKQAAIRYLVNGMNNYHLDKAAKEQEHGTIR